MLSIRRMTEKDLGPLTALLADERVMRYLEAPFTPERTQAFLAEAVIECSPSHAASRRVAEKCGFIVNGTRDDLLVLRLGAPATP